MTNELFDEVFSWIEKFHGKSGKLDEVVREEWQRKFSGEDDDIFCQAANLLISRTEPERFFPAIATMEKALTDIKEARWRAEKAASPTLAWGLRQERSESGRRALQTMMNLHEQKLSRREYIAFMHAEGWEKEANQLQRFWSNEQKRHLKGDLFFELRDNGDIYPRLAKRSANAMHSEIIDSEFLDRVWDYLQGEP